jgi:threonine synthase
MKGMFKILTVFYIVFPLVVIPLVAHRFANWYYLLGIISYYLGVILVAVKQKIFFMIPVIFCGWFWYTYGFSLHDYVFFMVTCMAGGALFYQFALEVEKFITRTLPENRQTEEFDLKIEEMNEKVHQYKQLHPKEKITPEILDRIRNEVFFK